MTRKFSAIRERTDFLAGVHVILALVRPCPGALWLSASPSDGTSSMGMPVALVPGNTRRMAFLAFKEALHNIVKHARATRVDIDFTVAGRRLSIRVCDNGRGFDPVTVSDTGNGLLNMQKRMEDIGGTFRIESGSGGTTVWFGVGW